MPEYITKEQAINVVDTAFGHIYDSGSTTVCLVDLQNEIIMTIDEHTEPADVVEVVRCKDCRFRKKREPLTGFKYFECILDGSQAVDPDFFCAHGERLDGGGND